MEPNLVTGGVDSYPKGTTGTTSYTQATGTDRVMNKGKKKKKRAANCKNADVHIHNYKNGFVNEIIPLLCLLSINMNFVRVST